MENERPHLDRHTHQRIVGRRRMRARRRRRARLRRLRMLRARRSARFWSRAGTYFVVAMCIVFWAKFAFVYDIPTGARQGALVNVSAYVAVKSWWFGPPVFDLGSFVPAFSETRLTVNTSTFLAIQLGRYQSILDPSGIVWARHLP